MDEMEAKLGAILNNPGMMQQIMSLAQNMSSQSQEQPQQESKPQGQFSLPDIDVGMLQKLSGFAKQSGIDKNQKNLLNALSPYLSKQRISKLEKAMRAAKMTSMATSFLQLNTGR